MSPTVMERLAPLLAVQHELVTSRQAASVGVHRAQLHRLARRGELVKLGPSLYSRPDADETWERQVLGPILVHRGSVASHRAGARLLDVPTFEGAAPEITIPSKRGVRPSGVIVHESRDIEYIPPVVVRGIPVTPPLRLAVDIGAVLGPVEYGTVLRELRRCHGASWPRLEAILALHSRKGRNGCGPLRTQIERYAGVDGIPDTSLEQTALDEFIDAGIPMPVCQHVVMLPRWGHARLDFAYPDILLAIEIDGPVHRLPEVRQRDAARDALLRGLGWEVLRFDEEVVVYRPGLMRAHVRAGLHSRGVPLVLPER